MALSDYMSDREYNAVLYIQQCEPNDPHYKNIKSFGDVMRYTIQLLIKNGYVFEGLDSNGEKKKPIFSDNDQKIKIHFGEGSEEELLAWCLDGRNLMIDNIPDFVEKYEPKEVTEFIQDLKIKKEE